VYAPWSRLKFLILPCSPTSKAAQNALCAPHVLSHLAVYAETLTDTRTQMAALFTETQFDPVVRIELCSEVLTMIRIGTGMLCSVLAQICSMMFTLQSPLLFTFIAFLVYMCPPPHPAPTVDHCATQPQAYAHQFVFNHH
jgi:hypothetical protein